MTAHAAWRTLLFVPGDRPERFDSAVASGADLVVVDLEDAVAPAAKELARRETVSWAAGRGSVAVRINAAGEPGHAADLAEVATTGAAVLVPKAEDPQQLRDLASRVDGAPVIALIETAAGILRAAELAAVSGVRRLVFGSYDLAAQLGVDPEDREALLAARQALVLASAAAGLPGPVDGVTGDLADADRLRDDVAYAGRLGFAGKLCIHPVQVATAREALRPSEADLAWARSVVRAAGSEGVAVIDGRMVDKPVVDRARGLLAGAPAVVEEQHEPR